MKSFDGKKYIYEKSQLVEVICQLRYPTILSIEANVPAEFQDKIREKLPRYSVNEEKVPTPKGLQTMKNHSFISADGSYKLSMTKDFIALSTMRYTSWEDFASWLDEPRGQFISIYKPAFFQRIGLRYVNGISRAKLELEVAGVVENMSGFICPNCGTRHDLFSTGGGEKLAAAHHVPLLAQLPLDPGFMRRCDAGSLPDELDGFPAIRDAMRAVAADLAAK